MIDKKKEQQKKLFHRRLKVQQLSRNKMKNTVNENHLFKQKKKQKKKSKNIQYLPRMILNFLERLQ